MSGRGKGLELALAREAAACLKSGRAGLVRQYPNVRMGPDGMQYVGDAPIDFLGARAGGQALALEAKETDRVEGLALDEDHLSAKQIKACRILAGLGVDVQLVIDYKRALEVFAVPWVHVDRFLAAPWRASLSRDFACAYGLLLPERDREDDKARRVLFLDGVPHVEQATALLRVQTERQSRAVVSLDAAHARDDASDERWAKRRGRKNAASESMAQLMARRPSPDDHRAYIAWLDEFTARELEANVGRARKAQRGRPGAWKGGNG